MLDILVDIEPPPKDMKPAKRYIANAQPTTRPGTFYGQFAFPGVEPRYVSSRGVPIIFDSEDEARAAAAIAVIESLNNRPKERSNPESYRKLTGPEFSVLLAEAGITPTFFSYLNNTRLERVFGWMDGTEEKDLAPHPVRVLLEILKRHPETIDTAEEVTESVTTTRKPDRSGG